MDKRLIIFEGTDGVGKSTVAETVATNIFDKGYRVDLMHYGPPANPTWQLEYLVDIVEGCPIQIHDRGFPGEPLWAKILNRAPLLSVFEFNHAVKQIKRATDLHVVFLTRPLDDVVATLQERGETPEQINISMQAHELYPRLAELLEDLSVDITVTTMNEALEMDFL
jgi:hypothetical protein